MKIFNFFKKSIKLVILLFLIVSIVLLPNKIFAAVMQSSTYRIQSDTVNMGGVDSSSASYNLNDTLGEVATGDSNSASYYMHAGYWQMQESSISISNPSDLVLPSMAGLFGGSSEGTLTWNVMTDNTAGYSMSVSTTTTPALKSSTDSLSDYTPASSDPDFNFTNASTASSFGFSPEGTDTIQRFLDNGSACNIGTLETVDKCWDGLSTTPKLVAKKTSSNMPSGSNVTVRFRAESGANHIQTSGVYNVTIVATAVTL